METTSIQRTMDSLEKKFYRLNEFNKDLLLDRRSRSATYEYYYVKLQSASSYVYNRVGNIVQTF